jgi:hypothetical protein
MKPRHAAALALVGWYLMLPLQAPDEEGTANAAPSPAGSSTFAVYRSHQDCEAERLQLLDDPVVGERMKSAQCWPTTNESTEGRRREGN